MTFYLGKIRSICPTWWVAKIHKVVRHFAYSKKFMDVRYIMVFRLDRDLPESTAALEGRRKFVGRIL